MSKPKPLASITAQPLRLFGHRTAHQLRAHQLFADLLRPTSVSIAFIRWPGEARALNGHDLLDQYLAVLRAIALAAVPATLRVKSISASNLVGAFIAK